MQDLQNLVRHLGDVFKQKSAFEDNEQLCNMLADSTMLTSHGSPQKAHATTVEEELQNLEAFDKEHNETQPRFEPGTVQVLDQQLADQSNMYKSPGKHSAENEKIEIHSISSINQNDMNLNQSVLLQAL